MITRQELNELEYQTQKYIEQSGQNMYATLKLVNQTRELFQEVEAFQRLERNVNAIVKLNEQTLADDDATESTKEVVKQRQSAYRYVQALIEDVRNGK